MKFPLEARFADYYFITKLIFLNMNENISGTSNYFVVTFQRLNIYNKPLLAE